MPISLSDDELAIVMDAAAPIRPGDRDVFLRDVAGCGAVREVNRPLAPRIVYTSGDVAQENVAVSRPDRCGGVHHDGKLVIAQRDRHGGFLGVVARCLRAVPLRNSRWFRPARGASAFGLPNTVPKAAMPRAAVRSERAAVCSSAPLGSAHRALAQSCTAQHNGDPANGLMVRMIAFAAFAVAMVVCLAVGDVGTNAQPAPVACVFCTFNQMVDLPPRAMHERSPPPSSAIA